MLISIFIILIYCQAAGGEDKILDEMVQLVKCRMWRKNSYKHTILPAKSDSDVMFCLQRYKGLIIYISLVY